MDLRSAYAKAEADLATAERRMADLARRVHELKIEKRGLELALARNGQAPVVRSETGSSSDSTDWNRLSRTDAILRIMEEHQGDDPLSPKTVLELLRQAGRSDTNAHAVSAALSYLRSRGKVETQGRGRWVLVAPPLAPVEPPTSEDPPPTDPPPEDSDLLDNEWYDFNVFPPERG